MHWRTFRRKKKSWNKTMSIELPFENLFVNWVCEICEWRIVTRWWSIVAALVCWNREGFFNCYLNCIKALFCFEKNAPRCAVCAAGVIRMPINGHRIHQSNYNRKCVCVCVEPALCEQLPKSLANSTSSTSISNPITWGAGLTGSRLLAVALRCNVKANQMHLRFTAW